MEVRRLELTEVLDRFTARVRVNWRLTNEEGVLALLHPRNSLLS